MNIFLAARSTAHAVKKDAVKVLNMASTFIIDAVIGSTVSHYLLHAWREESMQGSPIEWCGKEL